MAFHSILLLILVDFSSDTIARALIHRRKSWLIKVRGYVHTTKLCRIPDWLSDREFLESLPAAILGTKIPSLWLDDRRLVIEIDASYLDIFIASGCIQVLCVRTCICIHRGAVARFVSMCGESSVHVCDLICRAKQRANQTWSKELILKQTLRITKRTAM